MTIKIVTSLKMPISTVRAILKKFKATGIVTRGPMFILPPRTVRWMIRGFPKDESSILGS